MLVRNAILRITQSKALVSLVRQLGGRSGLARRFVAGETIQEALAAVRELNEGGIDVTLNLLGEGVNVEKEARLATEAYISLLESIHRQEVASQISIKLTQLGLELSPEVCSAHLKLLLDRVCQLENFVRIDMESSRYTESTIELFKEHFCQYGEHVGVVLQANLHRSEEDLRQLIQLKCNIRLCKGAYLEPPEVAFKQKVDVDRNFVSLLEILLDSESYAAVATHDEKVIQHVIGLAARHRISTSRFEFQMLYGIRQHLQVRLLDEGYRVRAYVPFGTQWAPYLMRRLGERPANLLFLLRNLLRR